MDRDKKKKIVAAISGVMTHIKQDEEAAGGAFNGQAIALPEALSQNLWGLNGRQQMMNMRNMMQFKAFNK
jgi:hypothetical protein